MSATVAELLAEAPTPARRDAEVLLCHCLERNRSYLYSWPAQAVAAAVADRYRALLRRHLTGEPVAYLTGEREFWSLPLRVTSATLVPRPDSETLVSWALDLPLSAGARVLDAGTGSGAIALALATERPGWCLSGLDRSPAALAVARENAVRLGLTAVSFIASDWFAALGAARFDLIVANPPYLAADDPHLAGPELSHEPATALVAGASGLEALAALAAAAPGYLRPGGWLLLEHGCDQGPAVRELLRAAGFGAIERRRDLAGHERASGGRRGVE